MTPKQSAPKTKASKPQAPVEEARTDQPCRRWLTPEEEEKLFAQIYQKVNAG